ncbi:unnamed protein product [Urochloa decumbens]|uniref:AIPP2-like SPOC-like domain-containing protein n=1 Tax=Urochloa decumbens TaxID=240449 RepID=A0ABC8W827_9POAL
MENQRQPSSSYFGPKPRMSTRAKATNGSTRRGSRFRSKRMNKIAKDMEKCKAYMPPNMVKRNDKSGVVVTDNALVHSGKKTRWGDRRDQNGNIPTKDSYVSIAGESSDVLPVKKNSTNKSNQSLSHISKNAKQSPTSWIDNDLIPLMDIKSSNPSRVKPLKELENSTPLRSKDGSNAELGYQKQSHFRNRTSRPIHSEVIARSAHQERNVDASNNVNSMRKKKEDKLTTYDDGDRTRAIRRDNLTRRTIKRRRPMPSNEDGHEVGGCKKNMTDGDGTNGSTRQEKDCVKQQCNNCLKPISKPPWSGIFRINGKEYISLAGHLSTKSCEKVWELSKSLPPVVEVEMVSRLVAWPKIWNASKPSSSNIGLYFLPPNMRHDEELDQLVNAVMENDLLLRAVINEAKMLVFPSVLLPKRYQMFQGKYYLWAAFEPREGEDAVLAEP